MSEILVGFMGAAKDIQPFVLISHGTFLQTFQSAFEAICGLRALTIIIIITD